ncbi:hypothetical protein [Helicobacter sp. 12S02232-10]|nr:hypothetical protein [Helicobacter sp. 12S02232-10]
MKFLSPLVIAIQIFFIACDEMPTSPGKKYWKDLLEKAEKNSN